MTWNNIEYLVRLAQGGDRDAYGELVKQFHPAVYGVALSKLRNVAEAQELTQDVFIHVMRKLDQLRDPHCFGGWLRQITVRMAINRLTRLPRVHGADPEVLQNAADDGQSPLDDMVREETRASVWTSLKRLKKIDRETLVAFYIHGDSLKKMAEDFDTPVGTIKRRLHVARNRLREQIARDGAVDDFGDSQYEADEPDMVLMA